MMKNKFFLKKTILKNVIISLIIIFIFVVINIKEYKSYMKNYNNKLISISNTIKDKYPDIEDVEIINIINSNNETNIDLFKQYGYDINKESIIRENDQSFTNYIIWEILIIILLVIILNYYYLKYNKKKDKEVEDIIKLIDKINHRNYDLNIDDISEEELSILKSEIYKTTIMLRECADNSIKDKLHLKRTLEDISHQLKTPLTSILINLDNIIDNHNLDTTKKDAILRKIKKEVYNIKFLVESLLKLSRFDVNTVKYNKRDILVNDLIDSSIQNVSTLADLKNIIISVNRDKNNKIYCDSMWQVEAITNILKNAIEHAYLNTNIKILCNSNKVYNKITIINHGDNISKKDLKHIFERFYKGENSSNDSIGIGLALAKAIVEEDNGHIYVESKNNETKFIIKYFKL